MAHEPTTVHPPFHPTRGVRRRTARPSRFSKSGLWVPALYSIGGLVYAPREGSRRRPKRSIPLKPTMKLPPPERRRVARRHGTSQNRTCSEADPLPEAIESNNVESTAAHLKPSPIDHGHMRRSGQDACVPLSKKRSHRHVPKVMGPVAQASGAISVARTSSAHQEQSAQRLLTIRQVAESLAISPQTVVRRVKEGKIQALKIGRHVRFAPQSIASYLSLSAIRSSDQSLTDHISRATGKD